MRNMRAIVHICTYICTRNLRTSLEKQAVFGWFSLVSWRFMSGHTKLVQPNLKSFSLKLKSLHLLYCYFWMFNLFSFVDFSWDTKCWIINQNKVIPTSGSVTNMLVNHHLLYTHIIFPLQWMYFKGWKYGHFNSMN